MSHPADPSYMQCCSCWDPRRYHFELPRCAGQAATTSNNQIKLAVTTSPDKGLWLINEGDEALAVASGEMCGFNVGAFTERLLSAAKSKQDAVPFIIEHDYSLMVMVEPAGKRLVSVSDLICELAGQGTTEVNVTDHDLVQTMQACCFMQFVCCMIQL